MGRRVRHLNPGSAGAVLALDSRFISGLSDGDPVSTWSDRSGSGNNATQTGTARPTFETAEQGGQPVIRFDGSNDYLNAGDVCDLRTNSLVMICVSKYRVSNSNGALCGKSSARILQGRYSLIRDVGNMIALYGGGTADPPYNDQRVQAADTSSTFRVVTMGLNRANFNSLFYNGDQQATKIITDSTDHNISDLLFIGAYQNSGGSSSLAGYYLDGDIAQVIVQLTNAYSTPLRRRLEHSAAFAFKIPCS